MNVIVANQRSSVLSNLDIDIIKNVTGEYDADELVAMFKDFFYDKMILDITAIKNYRNIDIIQKIAIGLGENKLILVLSDDVCESVFLSDLVSIGVYNFTNNVNAIKNLIAKPNEYKDVAKLQQLNSGSVASKNNTTGGIKILGIRNITEHAGATTLLYMLKRELVDMFGPNIYGIEIGKKDFPVFNDKNLISVSEMDVESKLRDIYTAKIILIDLNDYKDESICDEVIYLIEPSSIKLNKLIKNNRKIFEQLLGKKIILNKSLLTNKDVTEFEYESNSKVFYNLPPLDERKKNMVLNDFLSRLGIGDATAAKKSDSKNIFGLFRRQM